MCVGAGGWVGVRVAVGGRGVGDGGIGVDVSVGVGVGGAGVGVRVVVVVEEGIGDFTTVGVGVVGPFRGVGLFRATAVGVGEGALVHALAMIESSPNTKNIQNEREKRRTISHQSGRDTKPRTTNETSRQPAVEYGQSITAARRATPNNSALASLTGVQYSKSYPPHPLPCRRT